MKNLNPENYIYFILVLFFLAVVTMAGYNGEKLREQCMADGKKEYECAGAHNHSGHKR